MKTKYTRSGAINNETAKSIHEIVSDGSLNADNNEITNITRLGHNIFLDIETNNIDADYEQFTKIITLPDEETAKDIADTLEGVKDDNDNAMNIDNFLPEGATVIDTTQVNILRRVNVTNIYATTTRDTILFINTTDYSELVYAYNDADEANAANKEIDDANSHIIQLMRDNGVSIDYGNGEIIIQGNRECVNVTDRGIVRPLGTLLNTSSLKRDGRLVSSECFSIAFDDNDEAERIYHMILEFLS